MPHLGHLPFQDRHFQTGVMVQMHMQRGDRQIGMVMMRRGQLPRHFARAVVIGIDQRRDAGRIGRGLGAGARQPGAGHVADGL